MQVVSNQIVNQHTNAVAAITQIAGLQAILGTLILCEKVAAETSKSQYSRSFLHLGLVSCERFQKPQYLSFGANRLRTKFQNHNIPAVFYTWPSFRRKRLLPKHQNRSVPSVFGCFWHLPSFRARGLRFVVACRRHPSQRKKRDGEGEKQRECERERDVQMWRYANVKMCMAGYVRMWDVLLSFRRTLRSRALGKNNETLSFQNFRDLKHRVFANRG